MTKLTHVPTKLTSLQTWTQCRFYTDGTNYCIKRQLMLQETVFTSLVDFFFDEIHFKDLGDKRPLHLSADPIPENENAEMKDEEVPAF